MYLKIHWLKLECNDIKQLRLGRKSEVGSRKKILTEKAGYRLFSFYKLIFNDLLTELFQKI